MRTKLTEHAGRLLEASAYPLSNAPLMTAQEGILVGDGTQTIPARVGGDITIDDRVRCCASRFPVSAGDALDVLID